MKITWCTDIHLNFVSYEKRLAFYDEINNTRSDILCVGGDIGESHLLETYLLEMSKNIDSLIFFVLGNHDFYKGSIQTTKKNIELLCSQNPKLWYAPSNGVKKLSGEVSLVGIDGWGDGRLGEFFLSNVSLNDHREIQELRFLTRSDLFSKLNQLGDWEAEILDQLLKTAINENKSRKVFILTHVPPFRFGAWHNGQISDDNWLPFFTCKAVGDVIESTALAYPDINFTVLCGHTHGGGKVDISDNITCLTGETGYGHPNIQKVFVI